MYSLLEYVRVYTRMKVLTLMYTHTRTHSHNHSHIYFHIFYGGARGVMVIDVGNGHGDTSSNPGRH